MEMLKLLGSRSKVSTPPLARSSVPPLPIWPVVWSRLKGTSVSRSQTASSKGFQRFAARWSNNSPPAGKSRRGRSEEHTSELQSQSNLVCRLLLEKKKKERIKILRKPQNHQDPQKFAGLDVKCRRSAQPRERR